MEGLAVACAWFAFRVSDFGFWALNFGVHRFRVLSSGHGFTVEIFWFMASG